MEVFRQIKLKIYSHDMNKKHIIILFCFFFCSVLCAQVKSVDEYLPVNYVKDASVDYTIYLQKALDENFNIKFPDFPILINSNGLNVKSNQVLNFSENSKLVMKPNTKERYGVLNIKHVKNVLINDPNIIGDKENHLGESGEWGMGINIWASSDITINNPKISKTWGDGIYIGEPPIQERKKNKSYANYNININGGIINDCLRNGISIISGINITIDGTSIQNMNTKAPKGAIDIEPNNKNNQIKNIILKNIITKNNFNGIIIYLVNLAQEKKYDIDEIVIENHRDYESNNALIIRTYHKKLKKYNDVKGVAGEIKINNNSYFGTKNIYSHHPDIIFNPKIEFSNIRYYKKKLGKYILDTKANNLFLERINKDPRVQILK